MGVVQRSRDSWSPESSSSPPLDCNSTVAVFPCIVKPAYYLRITWVKPIVLLLPMQTLAVGSSCRNSTSTSRCVNAHIYVVLKSCPSPSRRRARASSFCNIHTIACSDERTFRNTCADSTEREQIDICHAGEGRHCRPYVSPTPRNGSVTESARIRPPP